MKATNSPAFSPFTALTLKVVGIILIVSSVVNYIVMTIPFNPQDRQWQVSFTNQLVDRGILPMVGIAFLVAGSWIGNIAAVSETNRKIWQDLRFWAFLLSSLLGLVFLLLVPLHLNNIRLESNNALEQINQKSAQAESAIAARSQQIAALAADQKKLAEIDQAIKSGKVQGEQLAQLQAAKEQIQTLKRNPNSLKQEIDAAQTQVRNDKLQAQKQTQAAAWKLSIQTGLSSLLLAIGYAVIGWTGLRGLLSPQAGRRKAEKW